MVETHETIKFCLKLGYKPSEMLNFCYKEIWDALEMKNNNVFLAHAVLAWTKEHSRLP